MVLATEKITIVSVLFCNKKTKKNLLFMQLKTFVILSAVFALYSFRWSFSAFLGGLCAWLPNLIFMIFICKNDEKKTVSEGAIAYHFAVGEGIKIGLTIFLFLFIFWQFNINLIPFILTYLSVFIAQIRGAHLN